MSSTGYFQYTMRTQVHCGAGSIIRVPTLFEGLGAKRVVLFSDAGLKQVGIVDQFIEIFNNKISGNMPILAGVYTDIEPDAGCNTVNKALAYAREVAADAILAVGGGSVLDAAKGVKYAMHHKLIDFTDVVIGGVKLEQWPYAKPIQIPHISVPTTAGTGAEVSPVGVFHHEETNTKCNVAMPYINSDIAVLDPKLTLGLPAHLTAATGMDALTHAMEAVASPNANNFTDAHAMMAAQLIEQNLPKVIENGQDIDARSSMLQASTMAINAFMLSFNAIPVHNCAHAFGGLYEIPHGDANSALLPIVMEVLPEFYHASAERLAQAFNLDTGGKAGAALLPDVIARLRDFQQEIGAVTNFSKWGVKPEQLGEIIMAILSDPAAHFYKIPMDRIEKIALKVIG